MLQVLSKCFMAYNITELISWVGGAVAVAFERVDGGTQMFRMSHSCVKCPVHAWAVPLLGQGFICSKWINVGCSLDLRGGKT